LLLEGVTGQATVSIKLVMPW